MKTLTIAILCCAAGAALASTSHDSERDGFERLPTDLLRAIASLLPAKDFCALASASASVSTLLPQEVIVNLVSERLVDQVGKGECLRAALRIESAPPGFLLQVVVNLLRSYQLDPCDVRGALREARRYGHCTLIDVLVNHLNTSRSDADFSSPIFSRSSCDDVSRLAALPLSDLLPMHGLPRDRFLQVIAAKYRGSGYSSFFHDEWWNVRRRSNTIMSHALHLYKELNGTIDFKPVPFGQIASTQSIPEQSLEALEHRPDRFLIGTEKVIISHLLLVLKPESSLRFPPSLSSDVRRNFLLEAVKARRLDWVKALLKHELWNDVQLDLWNLRDVGSFPSYEPYHVPFANVLEVVDSVTSAFEMVLYHQMDQRSRSEQKSLLKLLLSHPNRRRHDPVVECLRDQVRAFKSVPLRPVIEETLLELEGRERAVDEYEWFGKFPNYM